MTNRHSLSLALAALVLSTTMATATVAPALPDPAHCHDATGMRIGTLVDGECQPPERPIIGWSGYDMSWGGEAYRWPIYAEPDAPARTQVGDDLPSRR